MAERIRYETKSHVARIALDRASKRNAFDLLMLRELAEAYTTFEDDPDVRCAIVHANGDHFTAGLDLAEVGPAVASGAALFPEGGVDPLGLRGRVRTKPVVIAIQGYCLTIGIELALACDVGIAASDVKCGQIEIKRGIFPFGGATIRLPARAGWGNAMRWLLTGDTFDANEALRLGLVQEVVAPGQQTERAITIAETIAKQAPLGVYATLESARIAEHEGEPAAARALLDQARKLMATDDAREGLMSFVERREGRFTGR
ncbi:crotonase/enoyl-CoA hydratase family protein [Sandaracinus amylolyticus]|uniref:crotonase/enoyl-CoA hydratase family protein n=1 Tax=Sandaracinus amylolyticus TaxID=927083 RepID=UPI001F47F3FF|nr:crotonase/enoyl-CoA hydratase family protein [Sandaracinus amylolyticus]UJR80748.1 Carnitinyl-CoA dehydratase [Sandaracinus amylolyticus]